MGLGAGCMVRVVDEDEGGWEAGDWRDWRACREARICRVGSMEIPRSTSPGGTTAPAPGGRIASVPVPVSVPVPFKVVAVVGDSSTITSPSSALSPPNTPPPPPPIPPFPFPFPPPTLKIALCFSFPIAPSSRNSALPGKRMYTAATVSGGKRLPGRRKTTMCEKDGVLGNVRANWVGEMVVREVRTGRDGRMAANILCVFGGGPGYLGV